MSSDCEWAVGTVVVEYDTAKIESALTMGVWSEEAQRIAERIDDRIEFDDRIRASIGWRPGNTHALYLSTVSRGEKFAVACDLRCWQGTEYDIRMLAASFRQIACSMFKVKS